jgi:hypothetical protein
MTVHNKKPLEIIAYTSIPQDSHILSTLVDALSSPHAYLYWSIVMAKPEAQVLTPNTGDNYASNTQSTLSPANYLSYIYSTYSHQSLNISNIAPTVNINSAMLVGKNTVFT